VAVVVAAWLQPRPDLTREDARRFTASVLEAAGFDAVDVTPLVTSAKDPPPPTQPDAVTLDVWVTAATVEGGLVSFSIDRNAAQVVRYLDQDPGGDAFLTEAQQRRIDDYDTDPALQRRVRRNVAATVAAALGAVVALALARRLGPSPGPAPEGPVTPAAKSRAKSRGKSRATS